MLRSQSEKGKTAEQVYQSAVVKYCYCGGKVTDEAWANKEAAFESWRSGQTICARGCTPALHNAFAAPLAEWASQLQVRAACWSREPPPTSKALCWSAREIAQLRDPYPRVVAYLARSCSPSTSPALTQCWKFRSAALNVRCQPGRLPGHIPKGGRADPGPADEDAGAMGKDDVRALFRAACDGDHEHPALKLAHEKMARIRART